MYSSLVELGLCLDRVVLKPDQLSRLASPIPAIEEKIDLNVFSLSLSPEVLPLRRPLTRE